jgi:hypothetical protein
MKGKLKKIDDKWFVEYSEWITKGGKKGVLGGYTRSINTKTLPLLMDSTTFTKDRSNFVVGSRVKFTEVLINPMGREVNPYDLGQNHSGCVWYAKIVEDKLEQKQHLIDMMRGDEELGLYDDTDTSEWGIYDESREIKFEDIFNDEKREKVKRVIHQHKVLQGLSLINPLHLRMTDNGHGEFPDGYKLTEKGIQYIIEQLNKEQDGK